MAKLTINALLELNTELSSRLSRLEGLQQDTSNKSTTYFGQESQNKVEKTPQYDPTQLEAKISQIRNHLFLAKSAIKQANASTTVDLDVNVESLLGVVA